MSNPAGKLSADRLWAAWKTFPKWFDEWWGQDFWESGLLSTSAAWTNGVVYPFIVTGLFKELKCKGRFEVQVGGQSRADCILVDSSRNELAHIEHENASLSKLSRDLPKVNGTTPLLKCGVGYGWMREIEEKIPRVFKPKITEFVRENPKQEWLIITGLYPNERDHSLDRKTDWLAFRFDLNGITSLPW